MKGVDRIIAQWPSTADLGRDLGLPYSTVAAWKQRGSIPVAYWQRLVHAAQRRGYRDITGDLLIETHGETAVDRPLGGFAEEPPPIAGEQRDSADGGTRAGQFSRWKQLRRGHFASVAEIAEHMRALRSEWDRR